MKEKQCMGCMEFYDSKFDVCPFCGSTENKEAKELLHIEPGTVITAPDGNQYVIGNSIGYGGFGVTYIGYDRKLKRKVAIKEYLPSEFATRALHKPDVMVNNSEKKKQQFEKGKDKFLQEAQKLAQVSNVDGIVHIYDSFEANNTAYIVMEYLEGETLSSYLEQKKMLTEEQATDMIVPVLQTLDEVHGHGIIHRDIAPDNIFLAKDGKGNTKVKLIDFGASRYASTSHSKSLTVLIKPGYSPAEQYQSNGEQGAYTDIYAVAAVLYRMVTGVQPVDAFERRTRIQSGKKDPLAAPSAYNSELSENFENALLNAMNVRVEDRSATASEFLEELISFEPVKRRGVSIRKIDFLKWPRWAKIAVPSALSATLMLVILFVTGVIHFDMAEETFDLPAEMAIVPDLTDTDFSNAQTIAEKHELQISNVGTVYSPGVPENIVQSQDVSIGTVVMKNSMISVFVSTGVEEYLMPDVTGMAQEMATSAIECMGVTVTIKTANQPGLRSGCVISQSIEPYMAVATGDSVVLTIADNGDSNAGKAPELVGLTYEEAIKNAANSGVTITVESKVFTEGCEAAKIISQSVEPGSDVEAGASIAVSVAIPWHEFEMPNLMYKSEKDAVQLLKNLGIKCETKAENNEVVAANLVLSQSVEKDSAITPGSKVSITVSKGSAPFKMPDVKGKTQEAAQDKLLDAGLSVSIEYGYDEKVKVGNVISQSIPAGNNVKKGASVTIVVCSKEGLIEVKSVVGLSENDAKSAIESQGFKVTVSKTESSNDKKGLVLSQLPAAGTMQTAGKVIAITVGAGRSEAPAPTKAPPGAWSEWNTSLPSGVTSSGYDIEQKVQYRYRTRDTTTSTSSSLSGWNQYDYSTEYGEYGEWSSWSSSYVSSSSTRQVDTRWIDATYRTEYNYSRYNEYDINTSGRRGWNGPAKGYWGGHYCQYYEERGWSTDPLSQTGSDSGFAIYGGNWYNQETRSVEVSSGYTQYRYRDRPIITTYYYERWSDWSPYSDSPVSSSSSVQVETITVYRYRTK